MWWEFFVSNFIWKQQQNKKQFMSAFLTCQNHLWKCKQKNPSKILGEKSNSSNSFTTRINNFIFLKEIKMKPPPLSFSP
jgi:hypothetical protein